MLIEIKSACQFLIKYISPHVSESQTKLFGLILSTLLHAKYASHWDPKNPNKGNAYRAITIFSECLDSTIMSAANAANIPNIGKYLPGELCLWIDPFNVSYKVGDRGNIITLYESNENNTRTKSNGLKQRNSIAEIYINKSTSQSNRTKKFNNNNFAMKKTLSNKENTLPKQNTNNSSTGNKKYETSEKNGKKDMQQQQKVISKQQHQPQYVVTTRELSPVAQSLRAQLYAQSRFTIPFLFPKENETSNPGPNETSFINGSSYSKPITVAQQILAN